MALLCRFTISYENIIDTIKLILYPQVRNCTTLLTIFLTIIKQTAPLEGNLLQCIAMRHYSPEKFKEKVMKKDCRLYINHFAYIQGYSYKLGFNQTKPGNWTSPKLMPNWSHQTVIHLISTTLIPWGIRMTNQSTLLGSTPKGCSNGVPLSSGLG